MQIEDQIKQRAEDIFYDCADAKLIFRNDSETTNKGYKLDDLTIDEILEEDTSENI